jgi:hypothetical protein
MMHMVRWMRWLLFAALLLVASAVHAQTRCTTPAAVGGGTITTCRGVTGAPAQQYRTREAVGGGLITTGNGRTCVTRPAVGGGTTTTCR